MTIKRIRAGNVYRPVNDSGDPTLYHGELAVDDATGVMKIGDGTSVWSALDPLPGGTGGSEAIDGGTP